MFVIIWKITTKCVKWDCVTGMFYFYFLFLIFFNDHRINDEKGQFKQKSILLKKKKKNLHLCKLHFEVSVATQIRPKTEAAAAAPLVSHVATSLSHLRSWDFAAWGWMWNSVLRQKQPSFKTFTWLILSSPASLFAPSHLYFLFCSQSNNQALTCRSFCSRVWVLKMILIIII